MELCGRKIHAIIFDLDGTLIDSTNVWGNVDQSFFEKRGMNIPKNYVEEIAHIGLKEAAIFTKEKYHIQDSIESIMQEWRNLSIKQYEQEVLLKPHVYEYLVKLKQNNIKLAIATANDKQLYEPCLKRLGIYDFFDFIADVDTVNAGKDSVKLYHYVAKKLNEKPENIAVFEDISVGLKTAYENGYISIAVYDEHSKKEDDLKRKYSHLFINDFQELL